MEYTATNFAFRGKPIETLTREEAIEALKQALNKLADITVHSDPLERAAFGLPSPRIRQ